MRVKIILYSESVFRVCLIFYFLKKSSFHYAVNVKYFGEISHEMVFTVNPIYILSVQYLMIIFLSVKEALILFIYSIKFDKQ